MKAANCDHILNEFKDYAYSVSHDLSAPIRAMVEFSKLLTTEPSNQLDTESKEYLSLIIGNGQKLQAMMDGLLQYSRLNTMAKPYAEIDVGKLLADCCNVLEEKLRRPGAVLSIGAMPTLYGDIDQIMRLFCILIDNALTYQPRGQAPNILISAKQKGDNWQFSITDNGIGIAPQHHIKVFKLFQRLHTEEEYPGIGAGLTIAEKIVHRHEGIIWFEPSKIGSTTVCFTLPTQVT